MIHLEEITPDNWRLGLSVTEQQKKFVSNDMKLLARAYAYRKHRSKALIIYHDDSPVGMALYHDCDVFNAYDFSQLFIDERYQRNGYGTEAAKQILDLMRTDKKYNKVILCYIDGNESARKLYEKLGFELTGERDDNEIIMQLTF